MTPFVASKIRVSTDTPSAWFFFHNSERKSRNLLPDSTFVHMWLPSRGNVPEELLIDGSHVTVDTPPFQTHFFCQSKTIRNGLWVETSSLDAVPNHGNVVGESLVSGIDSGRTAHACQVPVQRWHCKPVSFLLYPEGANRFTNGQESWLEGMGIRMVSDEPPHTYWGLSHNAVTEALSSTSLVCRICFLMIRSTVAGY